MKKRIISALSALLIGMSSLSAPMSSIAAEEELTDDLFFVSDYFNYYFQEGAQDLINDYYNLGVSHGRGNPSGTTSSYLKQAGTDKDVLVAKNVIITFGLYDYMSTTQHLISRKFPGLYNKDNPFSTPVDLAGKISVDEAEDFVSELDSRFSEVTETALDNITKICKTINEVNPRCRLIYTTVYNPTLITEKGLKEFLKDKPSSAETVYNMIRSTFSKHLDKLNGGIRKLDGKGVEIADIAEAFTVKGSDGKFGYCDIYTNMLTNPEDDVMANPLGNVAGAIAVIDVLGPAPDNTEAHFLYARNYLMDIYGRYPAERRKDIRRVIEIKPGDGDKNGSVDASDASLALSIYAKAQTGGKSDDSIEGKYEFIALDVDDSNTVDASDASTILAHYASVQSGGKGIL